MILRLRQQRPQLLGDVVMAELVIDRTSMPEDRDGRLLTVLLALAANAAVAVIKAVAGVVSSSAGLLAESVWYGLPLRHRIRAG